jgi:hypothetical protein
MLCTGPVTSVLTTITKEIPDGNAVEDELIESSSETNSDSKVAACNK